MAKFKLKRKIKMAGITVSVFYGSNFRKRGKAG